MNGGKKFDNKITYSTIDDSKKRRSGQDVVYDKDIYGREDAGQYSKYAQDFDDDAGLDKVTKKTKYNYTAPKEILEEAKFAGDHENPLEQTGRKIADREDKYHQRKNLRMISPPRFDPFTNPDKTPDTNVRSYADIMNEQKLENERHEILMKAARNKEIEKKKASDKKAEIKQTLMEQKAKERTSASVSTAISSSWDRAEKPTSISSSKWDTPGRVEDATPRRNRWDLTPSGEEPLSMRGKFGETPTPGRWDMKTPNRFGETPSRFAETPTPGQLRKSRWDDKTPNVIGGNMTPSAYGGFTPTPVRNSSIFGLIFQSGVLGLSTPGIHGISAVATMTPDRIQALRYEKEMDERNRPLTDEELDQMLPSAGYEVMKTF
jgi:Splicing factor 3B subunit 1.